MSSRSEVTGWYYWSLIRWYLVFDINHDDSSEKGARRAPAERSHWTMTRLTAPAGAPVADLGAEDNNSGSGLLVQIKVRRPLLQVQRCKPVLAPR